MLQAFSGGLLGSNTYVYATDGGEGMIVDCGVPPREVLDFIATHGIHVRYIVLTHGHYDHIDDIGDYAAAYPEAQVVCHAEERVLIGDPEGNLSCFFGAPKTYTLPYIPLVEGDVLSLARADGRAVCFTVLHTPGHTAGCMCLYCAEERVMFTGDVLFAEGYGRVDLKYASPHDMVASLERLRGYAGVTIYPGHGGARLLPQA